MAYAIKTTVPVDRSQAEIRKTVIKYGASAFATGEQGNVCVVQFEIEGRRVRFRLAMPPAPSKDATRASVTTYEQLCRSRWRSLALAIKAKLECVDAGITTIEEEFLAHIVLPNGETVGKVMQSQLVSAYASKKMPPLLGYTS